MSLYRIHPADNVGVNLQNGHKYALFPVRAGENVVKYGFPIGHALCEIHPGELVHTHNLKTNLSDTLSYRYTPKQSAACVKTEGLPRFIPAYRRKNGGIGIRNDIWILPMVGCVNETANEIARQTGALAFPHPYGCSQLGEDHETTRQILKGLALHPNAGGVLLLGLGCENNQMDAFLPLLGDYDRARIRTLICQEALDEVAEGVRIVKELQALAERDRRVQVPVSMLKVGLKCGGSDGFSGISANPLLGRFTDLLTAMGGACVLTEVPEMFGAETILMERCISKEVFDKTVRLINRFKEYFTAHGQTIYENPSPGNKKGGISTLEDKSLGCVQKGGSAPVTDVLDYGEQVKTGGLSLLNGPGNDMVAVTNLAAAGCHLILFTTGRGTPLGAPVPTIKVSSNLPLAQRKKNWIDFDASRLLEGRNLEKEFFEYVCAVAAGRLTQNERHGARSIAMMKDGVTL